MKSFLRVSISIYILVFSALGLKAQDCSCEDSFESAVGVYEKDYSLFMYKVTDENRDLYNAHTDIMRSKAKETTKLLDCKIVLEQWLDFFRDGHNYISLSTKSQISSEEIPISEKEFKSEYIKKKYEGNPLLGIWQSGAYKVAIIPNPKGSDKKRDFVGVILESTNENWNKNEIKFELTTTFATNYNANFMMGDHSTRPTKAQQLNIGKLSFDDLGDWRKVWPEISTDSNESEVISKFSQFHYTEVDGIPYLRFPDFYSVDGEHLDSIMKANHQKLTAADFIIVDVRENGGGDDVTYYPVLPYILSGPIQIPNTGLWMSEGNIQQFLETSDLKGKSVDEYSEEERQTYDYVMSLKGTAFFQNPDYAYTYEPDTIYSNPRKVILLTDREAGSSGETFVYRANQSDKVVVYGQNTAGIVDGFNGLSRDIGCFKLTYPSSFRAADVDENPIDPYGIAPDVYLDEKVDMLNYAIEHMKQLIRNEKAQN